MPKTLTVREHWHKAFEVGQSPNGALIVAEPSKKPAWRRQYRSASTTPQNQSQLNNVIMLNLPDRRAK